MVTQIIAHRGASQIAPENTMPAFKFAYQSGAEAIETDVHLTKDQVPVLIHDEHVNRTTNGKGDVNHFTFSQLQRLDAGSWFSTDFKDAQIISLEAFLQWAQFKPFNLQIELKNNKVNYQYIEDIVYEIISHYQLQNRTTLSTFNPASIKKMEQFNHIIEIAFLTAKKNRNLIQFTKDLGANALHIKYRLLSTNLVNECHKENMPIRVYTVNRINHMMKCLQSFCNGIITDLPDQGIQCRKVFNSKG